MYCNNCGTFIDDDSTFCSNCGHRVKNKKFIFPKFKKCLCVPTKKLLNAFFFVSSS